LKKTDTKKLILEKSTDLFYKYGFVKASIRDVVRAVGVTNSTVYVHFRNKNQILYEIIMDIGSTLLEELRKIVEKHDDSVECLSKMIFMQTCLIQKKRKEIKIYIEEQYQLLEPYKTRAARQQRQVYDLYYNKICQIEDKCILQSETDKTVIAFSAFAMMNWAYRWYNENGRLSIEEVANNALSIFFNGILIEKSLVVWNDKGGMR